MNSPTNYPRLEPYLSFNGQCDDALAFYADALDGEIEFLMRFRESPQPPGPGALPPGFENKVMHASLRIGTSRLLMTDGCSSGPLALEGVSLLLTAGSEAEAQNWFQALAEGGKIMMPLTSTFWSPCFGMLIDRFGLGWKVMVEGDRSHS